MISAEVQEKFVSDNKMCRFFVNPESRSRLHDTQTFRGVNGRSNEEGRAETPTPTYTLFFSRSSEAEHLAAIAVGHHLFISANMDYSGAGGYDKIKTNKNMH